MLISEMASIIGATIGALAAAGGGITGTAVSVRKVFQRREGTSTVRNYEQFLGCLDEAGHFMYMRGKL